jgi:hypothetical protein
MMFYEDDEILELESDLLEKAYFKGRDMRDRQAIRHLKEGLIRRLYMMRSSRIFMRENTQPDRKIPLGAHLSTELAVHVNGYYLNLCGSLDNMAWMLAYEWSMFPNLDENSLDSRRYCNLFGNRFRQDVRRRHGGLAQLLADHVDWNRELRDFRDPAAHRIPLYVSPGVITSEEVRDKFYEIGREAEKSEEERGGRSVSEIFEEQRALATYIPIIITSSPTGLTPHSIPSQIGADHTSFLKITQAVVSAL